MRELTARIGQGNLFEWIEDKAESLANRARGADGAVSVGREVLRVCGVDSIAPGRISARAELRSNAGCLSIVFNPTLSSEVQRFSIAHEIGHTLWLSTSPGEILRNRCATIGHNDQTIEMLCDYFAGALLVPRQDVKRFVSLVRRSRSGGSFSSEENECPLELVPELARRFRVQRRIAAWRLLLVQKLSSWFIVRVQNSQHIAGGLLFARDDSGRETWETVWYESGTVGRRVPTVEGYRVPFGTRRRIPGTMVPRNLTPKGRVQPLDSRWWEGVTPSPLARARRPFRYRVGTNSRLGLVARIEDSLYIAMDRERREQAVGKSGLQR